MGKMPLARLMILLVVGGGFSCVRSSNSDVRQMKNAYQFNCQLQSPRNQALAQIPEFQNLVKTNLHQLGTDYKAVPTQSPAWTAQDVEKVHSVIANLPDAAQNEIKARVAANYFVAPGNLPFSTPGLTTLADEHGDAEFTLISPERGKLDPIEAYLRHELGHAVEGAFLRNYASRTGKSAADVLQEYMADVAAVAAELRANPEVWNYAYQHIKSVDPSSRVSNPYTEVFPEVFDTYYCSQEAREWMKLLHRGKGQTADSQPHSQTFAFALKYLNPAPDEDPAERGNAGVNTASQQIPVFITAGQQPQQVVVLMASDISASLTVCYADANGQCQGNATNIALSPTNQVPFHVGMTAVQITSETSLRISDGQNVRILRLGSTSL